MTYSLEPTTLDEMPSTTAELALIRVLVEAHISTMPRTQAMAFLGTCVQILAEVEEADKVVPIRRGKNASASHLANRQALAAFRQILERCVTRLAQPGRAGAGAMGDDI